MIEACSVALDLNGHSAHFNHDEYVDCNHLTTTIAIGDGLRATKIECHKLSLMNQCRSANGRAIDDGVPPPETKKMSIQSFTIAFGFVSPFAARRDDSFVLARSPVRSFVCQLHHTAHESTRNHLPAINCRPMGCGRPLVCVHAALSPLRVAERQVSAAISHLITSTRHSFSFYLCSCKKQTSL